MSGDSRSFGALGYRMIRAAGGLLARGGKHGRLAILIYHRVLPEIDPLFPEIVDRRRFDRQMELLARCFRVLPLEQAAEQLRDGTLPPRAVCVSFDDGYRDNHDVALPVLRKWGVPATFFVTTGYLDGGHMWNDAIIEALRQASGPELDLTRLGLEVHGLGDAGQRRRAITTLIGKLKYLEPSRREQTVASIVEAAGARVPRDLMMDASHLPALCAAGMGIGAHTLSHPILARVDAQTARQEISGGKQELEKIIGRQVSLFAYPNGVPGTDYLAEHVDMVRQAGFKAAVSTAWGVATRRTPYFELPRFTPWDRTEMKFAARLLHNYLRTEPAIQNASPADAAHYG